jgi:AraC-like DNA-binding protein
MADLLCVEEAPGDLRPRIHGWFSMVLMRSPAVARVESHRSALVAAPCVLLLPRLQLHGMRTTSAEARPAVTLLLGSSHLDGLEACDQASIVTDPELGAQCAALVTQLDRPARSVECLVGLRSLLQRLLRRARPLGLPRSGRATPLDPVRDLLRTSSSEPVRTAALASISGLTESHLVRAYHLHYGLPPHAYHLRLRLASACELLAGGLSVSETAYECGFADQSHLSRKFKEVYRLTPAAWARAVAEGRPGRVRREPAVWRPRRERVLVSAHG